VAGFVGWVEEYENQSKVSVLTEALKLNSGELRKAIGSKGEPRATQVLSKGNKVRGALRVNFMLNSDWYDN